jgi:hypothetical protein
MDTPLDDLITKVRDAMEAAGLHTWELSEGIVNTYSAPVPPDGPEPIDEHYIGTITVTITR